MVKSVTTRLIDKLIIKHLIFVYLFILLGYGQIVYYFHLVLDLLLLFRMTLSGSAAQAVRSRDV